MYKPSDKLVARGAESLTEEELLTLLFNDQVGVEPLSEALLHNYNGSLVQLFSDDLSRLRIVEGLGLMRAERLKAVWELCRRCSAERASEMVVIADSDDVVRMFRPMLEGLRHEECWVLYLNASNRLMEYQRVSQGGVTATIVDQRIIVKRALELLASHIVVVHNHPSGASDPSAEDIELTQRLKGALALFDINLLDHIIITSGGEFSFLSGELL